MGDRDRRNRNVANQHRKIALRDGPGCFYCGPGYLAFNSRLTRDHVIPKSRGGYYVVENLVLACERDNHNRGDTEFVYYILNKPAAIRRLEKQSPLFVETARELGLLK